MKSFVMFEQDLIWFDYFQPEVIVFIADLVAVIVLI